MKTLRNLFVDVNTTHSPEIKTSKKSPRTPRSPNTKRNSLFVSDCEVDVEFEFENENENEIIIIPKTKTRRNSNTTFQYFNSFEIPLRESSEDFEDIISEINPHPEFPNYSYEGYFVNFLSVFTNEDMKKAFKEHLKEEFALSKKKKKFIH